MRFGSEKQARPAKKPRRKAGIRAIRACLELAEGKGIKIIMAEICPDHVHMLVEIPPRLSVSSVMGYLKGKRSTMLYEQLGELKYKYRSRKFWRMGTMWTRHEKTRAELQSTYETD